jgi:aldehyde reductase
MGYSPLGGSSDRAPEAHGTTLLEHPTVNAIAKDVNKTPGQVLIRWALQRGVISIPKSSNPDRLAQNFATLDWVLPDTAMGQLAGLESDFRYATCLHVANSVHEDVSSFETQPVCALGARC